MRSDEKYDRTKRCKRGVIYDQTRVKGANRCGDDHTRRCEKGRYKTWQRPKQLYTVQLLLDAFVHAY